MAPVRGRKYWETCGDFQNSFTPKSNDSYEGING